MKIEAITLREIHMPLVHFFETSFGRTYSRRILLVTVHSEGVDGWGECVAGEDPFYSSEWIESAWPTLTQYLIPALLGKAHRIRPRLPGTVRQSARPPHGQSRARKCALGRRSHAEAAAVVEVAGRDAPRDSLRRFHWHPGFGRATAGKNPDRTGRRIPPHQGQSQARLGRECARTASARAGPTLP